MGRVTGAQGGRGGGRGPWYDYRDTCEQNAIAPMATSSAAASRDGTTVSSIAKWTPRVIGSAMVMKRYLASSSEFRHRISSSASVFQHRSCVLRWSLL